MFQREQNAIEQQIRQYCASHGLPDPEAFVWAPIPFAGEWGISTNFFALAAANARQIKETSGQSLNVQQHAQELASSLAEALGTPLYLHPREPAPAMVQPFLDYGLYFAGLGFSVETSLHAMRLIMSGVFDEFPKLRVVLGHMGEGLPFWLKRLDNRYLLQVQIGAVTKLPRLPSEYFLDHFVVTTSGMTSAPVLKMCIEVLGSERILFAADYPYEDARESVRFLDAADIPSAQRDQIYRANAERVFGWP